MDFKKVVIVAALCCGSAGLAAQGQSGGEPKSEGWRLVWSDEFDHDGPLDSCSWNYEEGFMRNHEAQWYQPANAYCKDGCLVIEARVEQGERKSPVYEPGSKRWPQSVSCIRYTSASVNTAMKREFRYGRVEVRAKIPTASGAWPAIWLLGRGMEWPSCGEIDMMEFYRIQGVPHILANACWGTDEPYRAKWSSKAVPFSHFTDLDSLWEQKFHVWQMDWDEQAICLSLDGKVVQLVHQTDAVNGRIGKGSQPFKSPMYILLNLALGGDHGGAIDDRAFPLSYYIDYVRVYQRE